MPQIVAGSRGAPLGAAGRLRLHYGFRHAAGTVPQDAPRDQRAALARALTAPALSPICSRAWASKLQLRRGKSVPAGANELDLAARLAAACHWRCARRTRARRCQSTALRGSTRSARSRVAAADSRRPAFSWRLALSSSATTAGAWGIDSAGVGCATSGGAGCGSSGATGAGAAGAAADGSGADGAGGFGVGAGRAATGGCADFGAGDGGDLGGARVPHAARTTGSMTNNERVYVALIGTAPSTNRPIAVSRPRRPARTARARWAPSLRKRDNVPPRDFSLAFVGCWWVCFWFVFF